jgi:hypothetical protein
LGAKAKQIRTAKMIRQLRKLGHRVELPVPLPLPNPA